MLQVLVEEVACNFNVPSQRQNMAQAKNSSLTHILKTRVAMKQGSLVNSILHGSPFCMLMVFLMMLKRNGRMKSDPLEKKLCPISPVSGVPLYRHLWFRHLGNLSILTFSWSGLVRSSSSMLSLCHSVIIIIIIISVTCAWWRLG